MRYVAGRKEERLTVAVSIPHHDLFRLACMSRYVAIQHMTLASAEQRAIWRKDAEVLSSRRTGQRMCSSGCDGSRRRRGCVLSSKVLRDIRMRKHVGPDGRGDRCASLGMQPML
jgi:hypothetical protein